MRERRRIKKSHFAIFGAVIVFLSTYTPLVIWLHDVKVAAEETQEDVQSLHAEVHTLINIERGKSQ